MTHPLYRSLSVARRRRLAPSIPTRAHCSHRRAKGHAPKGASGRTAVSAGASGCAAHVRRLGTAIVRCGARLRREGAMARLAPAQPYVGRARAGVHLSLRSTSFGACVAPRTRALLPNVHACRGWSTRRQAGAAHLSPDDRWHGLAAARGPGGDLERMSNRRRRREDCRPDGGPGGVAASTVRGGKRWTTPSRPCISGI